MSLVNNAVVFKYVHVIKIYLKRYVICSLIKTQNKTAPHKKTNKQTNKQTNKKTFATSEQITYCTFVTLTTSHANAQKSKKFSCNDSTLSELSLWLVGHVSDQVRLTEFWPTKAFYLSASTDRTYARKITPSHYHDVRRKKDMVFPKTTKPDQTRHNNGRNLTQYSAVLETGMTKYRMKYWLVFQA